MATKLTSIMFLELLRALVTGQHAYLSRACNRTTRADDMQGGAAAMQSETMQRNALWPAPCPQRPFPSPIFGWFRGPLGRGLKIETKTWR